MPSTTTVADFLLRVSVNLNDSDPQFVRWLQSELVRATNDGQRAIAKYLPFSCSRVDAIKLRSGPRQSIGAILTGNYVPGDGVSVGNIVGTQLLSVNANMGSDGTTWGKAIRLVDMEALDASDPSWRSTTGTVVRGFMVDPLTPKVFYVTPAVPDTDGVSVWVEASYLTDPVALDADTDYSASGAVISIDDKYVDDLFNYVMARAYMKDAEDASVAAVAQMHVNLFTASINTQSQIMLGVNPNLKSLPFNPSTPASAR